MVDVLLPYGKSKICVRVPTRNLLGSIEPKEKPGARDPRAEIEGALRSPLDSKRLNKIAKPGNSVAIVIDDATRPVPSYLMVPPLLDELRVAGVKDENITIIFACGTHGPVPYEKAVSLLGEKVVDSIKTVSHDQKAQDLINVGTTEKHKNKVLLNRAYVEADVRVITGDVNFHYMAGYGGGRKSILPGISGEETIEHNHAMLLDARRHMLSRTGSLNGNPVHEDMVEAARLARVDFALNVVMNGGHEIVKAFAGSLDQVFLEGVKLVDEMYRLHVDRCAEIVIVSPGGHPADLNLFQAYKAVDNALAIVKQDGVIILVAELPDGHGNQNFYNWMIKFGELKAVAKDFKGNPALRRSFVSGGYKAYMYLMAMQKAQIALVSSMRDYCATTVFKMKTARTVNDALNHAFDIAGKSAKVWIMPFGSITLPEVKAIAETEQQK